MYVLIVIMNGNIHNLFKNDFYLYNIIIYIMEKN